MMTGLVLWMDRTQGMVELLFVMCKPVSCGSNYSGLDFLSSLICSVCIGPGFEFRS